MCGVRVCTCSCAGECCTHVCQPTHVSVCAHEECVCTCARVQKCVQVRMRARVCEHMRVCECVHEERVCTCVRVHVCERMRARREDRAPSAPPAPAVGSPSALRVWSGLTWRPRHCAERGAVSLPVPLTLSTTTSRLQESHSSGGQRSQSAPGGPGKLRAAGVGVPGTAGPALGGPRSSPRLREAHLVTALWSQPQGRRDAAGWDVAGLAPRRGGRCPRGNAAPRVVRDGSPGRDAPATTAGVLSRS